MQLLNGGIQELYECLMKILKTTANEENGERPAHLVSNAAFLVVFPLICIDCTRTLSSCGGNDGNLAKPYETLSIVVGNFGKNFGGCMFVTGLSMF